MPAHKMDEDELKAVEQTLARLAQLSSSIQSLRGDVLKSNPLPPASSLQASTQILQRNLQSLHESLTENAEIFNRLAIHPSPNYPGRTQEPVLTQLLRKKLEPDVEEHFSEGREVARLITPTGINDLQDIWHDSRQWVQERIKHYVRDEASDVYTAEERATGIENVRTGLRRDLEDDDEDDDDEEDDEENAADGRQKVRGPEPETLLWFAARGDFEVPRNVEYERKRDVYKGLQGVSIPPGFSEQPLANAPS
ncbi:hypothetical protein FDECE_18038 [Fusarium decemcellulare]|nr:hypothetical protein FDECE_18038 [Fusarium decemcellulare]